MNKHISFLQVSHLRFLISSIFLKIITISTIYWVLVMCEPVAQALIKDNNDPQNEYYIFILNF